MEPVWRLRRCLAPNRSHHPDKPDGVGLVPRRCLAPNRSHHPDKPDGVGLVPCHCLAPNRSHHPDKPDGVGLVPAPLSGPQSLSSFGQAGWSRFGALAIALASNRSHHPDKPDGAGLCSHHFSGPQSFSSFGQAGWSRFVLAPFLAPNRSHHSDNSLMFPPPLLHPFRARKLHSALIPRALPWADFVRAFQAPNTGLWPPEAKVGSYGAERSGTRPRICGES